MKTNFVPYSWCTSWSGGKRVLFASRFGHRLMSWPECRFAQKKTGGSPKRAPAAKTASPFAVYGVLIGRRWLDGGGKRSPSTVKAIVGQLPNSDRLERTQARIASQRWMERPPSKNQLLRMNCQGRSGRAYSDRRGESVARSDRRRCELEVRKLIAAARPACLNPRRENTPDYCQTPSPSGLRIKSQNSVSELDSNRTPFYD